MSKAITLAAVLMSLTSTACISRTITGLADHPTANVSYLETHDAFLFQQTDQFWECTDDGKALECRKSCDSDKSAVQCFHVYPAFLSTNLD